MRQGAVFHSSLSTECVTVQHWYMYMLNKCNHCDCEAVSKANFHKTLSAECVRTVQDWSHSITPTKTISYISDKQTWLCQMPKPSHTTQDHLIQLIQTNFITPKPACYKNFQKRPVYKLRCIVCKNKTHSGLLLTRSSEHNPCPNGLWHFFIVNLGVSKSMKVNISTWRLPK